MTGLIFSLFVLFCSVWFSSVLADGALSHWGKHAFRIRWLLMISQIDIVVVKLSHDVTSCGVSAACTYVDLILDIFDFFATALLFYVVSFPAQDIGFRRSFNITFSQSLRTRFACFPNNFSLHCQLNIAVDFQCNQKLWFIHLCLARASFIRSNFGSVYIMTFVIDLAPKQPNTPREFKTISIIMIMVRQYKPFRTTLENWV